MEINRIDNVDNVEYTFEWSILLFFDDEGDDDNTTLRLIGVDGGSVGLSGDIEWLVHDNCDGLATNGDGDFKGLGDDVE